MLTVLTPRRFPVASVHMVVNNFIVVIYVTLLLNNTFLKSVRNIDKFAFVLQWNAIFLISLRHHY